jgi:transposase
MILSMILGRELMRRFIEEADRGQSTLLPECLDDFVDEGNPVRVIDVFVDALDLAEMGFDGVDPAATGRPSYHPSVLLKLYIYGYLNRVQSSRRLEREAGRNVEVMWLLGRLVPDHKTIADFRKDNGLGLRKVCARFVELCREMGLLATASVAIDGSKFKAVNNRDRNFTRAKVERRRAQLEESVARYLSQLDTADRQEPTEALAAKVTRLKEKLAKVKEQMGKLAVYEKQMLASPDQQISLTDPDSRSMATSGRGSGVVGYNVQVAVDTDHHLIITHEVTNSGSDRAQLANMARQAKNVLQTETLDAVADRGYFSSPEILACHEAGITVTLPKPMTSGAKSDGRFGKQDFVYLPEDDAYRRRRRTTPIVVRPGSGCRIDIQTKKPTRCCGATGPTPARIVRSNPSARPGPSDGSRDGNTSICSTPCSSGSMRTRSPCDYVARPSSIRSAP